VWVEGGDIQDELLDQLGAVLTAPDAAGSGDTPGPPGLTLTPSAAEFEALAAAVAARWPDGAAAPADGERIAERAGSVHQIRSAGRRPLRRLGSSAWRAGSVAAGIVVFSASAAAANGGVPLPRPVRMVAYTVGLPVDSPALDTTNRHVEELKKAVKANDKPKAQATARRLQSDLTKVPGHEKKEAEQKVVAVMQIAEPLVAPSPTTTSTAPAPSTTVTTAASPTTATTAEAEEKKEQERERDRDKDTKVPASTTTTAPAATTTTEPETTTTSTAPATDETPSDGSGTPSGEPGTGSGDPGAGGAGTGGGEPGSTTPTTIPDGETTTTTGPDGGGAPGGDDPGSTTTTTSSTTTTTMPPPDPGASAASNPSRGPRHYRQ
jgi:hypothetical protein